MRSLLAVVTLALLLGIIATPAAAQSEVKDWDDVDAPQFDTSETDSANRQISEGDAAYGRLEGEIARVEEEVGPLSGAEEISALEQDKDAAEADVLSGIDDLLAARTEAVEEAEVTGSPEAREDQLDNKLAALRDVESYAEEWDAAAPSVATVQAEVEAEKEAAEEEQEAAEAPETTASPATTSAPPAQGQGGGQDQGASPTGDTGDTPGGLGQTLRTGGIGAGLALAAAGVVAVIARRRPRKPTRGNVAPREAEDYDPETPTVGGRDE